MKWTTEPKTMERWDEVRPTLPSLPAGWGWDMEIVDYPAVAPLFPDNPVASVTVSTEGDLEIDSVSDYSTLTILRIPLSLLRSLGTATVLHREPRETT